MYPDDLKYTTEHEWVRSTDSGAVRIGITAFAQDALGDVVYVSLPTVGDTVTAGDTCGEVESTKSVSDLYAPVSGTVVAGSDVGAAVTWGSSCRSVAAPRPPPTHSAPITAARTTAALPRGLRRNGRRAGPRQ